MARPILGGAALALALLAPAVATGADLTQQQQAARLHSQLDHLEYELAMLEARLSSSDSAAGDRKEALRSGTREESARLARLRRRLEVAQRSGEPPEAVEVRLTELLQRLPARWSAQRRLAGLAAGTPDEEPATRSPGTGSISGRVIDALTGLGITSARVEITTGLGGYRSVAYTGAQGDYYFGGLADDVYYLFAGYGGAYIAEVYDDIPCDGYCDPEEGTGVVVAVGGAVTDVDFLLDRGAKFTGRITAADTGLGLDDVSVRVYDQSGDQVNWTWTGANGLYETNGMPTGTYFVVATSPDGYVPQLHESIPCSGCDPTTGTPVVAVVNTITSGVDFALQRGAAIAGTVTDAATGAPLPDVLVRVYTADGARAETAATDGLGRYATQTSLLPGDHYLEAFPSNTHQAELYDELPCVTSCDPLSGTAVEVVGTTTVDGIDFTLDQAAIVSGRAFDPVTGLGISGARISVFDNANGYLGEDYSFDITGQYAVGRLPGGTVYLKASGAGAHVSQLYDSLPCPLQDCVPNSGTPVVAPLSAITEDIDFPLPRGGGISGTVVDAVTGAPVPDVTVDIYRQGSASLDSPVTDSLGRFATERGLEAENHWAVARPYRGAPYMAEVYEDVAWSWEPWIDGTPIPVSLGSVTAGVDIALDVGGTLSGTVTAADTGLALARVSVHLADEEGRYQGTETTNVAGYYEFVGLSPQDYFVSTYGSPVPYLEALFDGGLCEPSCDPATGTPVPVTLASPSVGVDMALTRGGLISGRIVDATTGQAISSAWVTIDGTDRHTDYSRQGGVFSSQALLPGIYYLRVRMSGYHDQRYSGLSCETNCPMDLATPLSIALGSSLTADSSLYPTGLDPYLWISAETLYDGQHSSCGTLALGPAVEVEGHSSLIAGEAVVLNDGTSVTTGITATNDPTLTCP